MKLRNWRGNSKTEGKKGKAILLTKSFCGGIVQKVTKASEVEGKTVPCFVVKDFDKKRKKRS